MTYPMGFPNGWPSGHGAGKCPCLGEMNTGVCLFCCVVFRGGQLHVCNLLSNDSEKE